MRQIVRANKLLQPPIVWSVTENLPTIRRFATIDHPWLNSNLFADIRSTWTSWFHDANSAQPRNRPISKKSRKPGIRRILPKPRNPGNRPISGKRAIEGYPGFWGPGPQNSPPRPGTPELPSRTQELPCLGGYPPELAWSKGKYAVFCCFLLNSTEFREFPVGGPQKRVFRYPGSKGNFVVSGTPKSAKPGNRPKPGQTGPRPPIPGFQGLQTPNSGPRPGRANFSLSGSYQGWLVTKQYIIPDFLVRFRAFLP